ncbi:MAG: threonine--tRNA ligase [Candidatus Saganbacteria bacterium]|nr:threonine--tRNA ligase [Candidatus Saganbacteria bacterium]
MSENLETLRHSTSHVLAEAVQALYPGTKLGIGPAIEDGFYYDFDFSNPITDADLPAIEAKMEEIIKKNEKFERTELSKEEAIGIMEEKGEKYKVELLLDLTDPKVSFYKSGNFTDLCRGPHIESTGQIKAFKLLSVAGAYWHGIETNPMLTRIYGTVFASKDELKKYLDHLEEAKKRDHRKLGKELDLFSIQHEDAGAGFVYWHPKGAMLRNIIEQFLKDENLKRGYELVCIPHIAKINLFQKSGHTSYYKENMYFMQIDEQDYVIKPMNCPGHCLIYQRKVQSYRDLPVKFFELGTVYRYEKSGVLHGLLRVRGFTQDDAHIYCRPDQLEGQIIEVLDFIDYVMKVFHFDYVVNLSTRPEKYVGTEEGWEHATDALKHAMDCKEIKYDIDEGAGVFYGPKIDIKLKDAIGRLWQGPTVQVDFNNPERFDLCFAAADNTKQRPVMIHRAILGSLERFIGALIENFGGAFPFWLSPVQLAILPISDQQIAYAQTIAASLREAGFRVEIDVRNEKIGHKIREAQLQKTPYMLIVGKKEVEEGKVALRSRGQGDLGGVSLEALMARLKQEVLEKK